MVDIIDIWRNLPILTVEDILQCKGEVLCFWYGDSPTDIKEGWMGKVDVIMYNGSAVDLFDFEYARDVDEVDVSDIKVNDFTFDIDGLSDIIEDNELIDSDKVEPIYIEECSSQIYVAKPTEEMLEYYNNLFK